MKSTVSTVLNRDVEQHAMKLNTLSPAQGAKRSKARVGRGGGSGLGKTCGRGHKGQRARAGGFHKSGFEGGQSPLQRRLPKFGFTSRVGRCTQEVRLSDIAALDFSGAVDIQVLKDFGVINNNIKYVKVIQHGVIERPVVLQGLQVTKGAKALIEQAGGSVLLPVTDSSEQQLAG
jgi:large subunit ribosomal protein L15